jgi:hypothetical protein
MEHAASLSLMGWGKTVMCSTHHSALAPSACLGHTLHMGKVLVKIKLTFVVDPRGQKLIPNPEHGDKQMSEEY